MRGTSNSKAKKTYAALDSCNQAIFVKECLLRYLNSLRRNILITIKIMNEEFTGTSTALKNLEVLRVSERKKERRLTKLPTTIMQKDLLFDSAEICLQRSS